MRFYIASPLFTNEEKTRIIEVSTYLRSLGYEVYSPMEHNIPNAWNLSNSKWAKSVFDEDVKELDKSDKVIVIYDGLYSDTGTAWEVGYAYARGNEIYVLCTKSKFDTGSISETSITLNSICPVECKTQNQEASLMMVNGSYTTIYYEQLREYDFEKNEKIICDVNQK